MLGGGRHCRRCRLGVGVGVGLVDPGVDTKLVELSEELIARGFVAFGGHGLFSFCGNTRRFSGRDARMGYIVEVDGPIGGGGVLWSTRKRRARGGPSVAGQAVELTFGAACDDLCQESPDGGHGARPRSAWQDASVEGTYEGWQTVEQFLSYWLVLASSAFY